MWASKQIDQQDYASFVRDARDYALLNGLVLRYEHLTNDNCVAHIPFTLFPSPYPNKLYRECLNLQPIVNKLMFKIASDTDFINDILGPIARVDKFTENLLNINNVVRREGIAQPTMSCINRADYMLDRYTNSAEPHLRVRQVEVNAIASSMSAHSRNTKAMQEFLLTKYCIDKPSSGTTMPENDSLALVVQGLIGAFDSYGKSSAFILLVAEGRSMNFSDQVLIELELTKCRPDIKFVRRSFVDLQDRIRLGPNKELILESTKEIALVYFRYCYDPSNFNFDNAWDVRLLLERSKAIKCPSINFHLSGAKKFQQTLNSSHQLERYLDPNEAEKLSQVFCKFWSFESDNPTSKDGYQMALTESDNLVLKPQREGGGHNIFGKDIKPFFEKIATTDERSQYILMEYIDGPREKNWLLMYSDDPKEDKTRLNTCDQLVSELGIFGSILADAETSTIKANKSAGYLVRSKNFGVNEGGVASGYAGISNLILVDDLESNYSDYFQDSLC